MQLIGLRILWLLSFLKEKCTGIKIQELFIFYVELGVTLLLFDYKKLFHYIKG